MLTLPGGVKEGEKEHVMRNGWWGGKPQKMNDSVSVPKWLQTVLEERGVSTRHDCRQHAQHLERISRLQKSRVRLGCFSA